MAKTKEQERKYKDVQEDQQRLRDARRGINDRLQELDQQITTGVIKAAEEREKALKKGYPAKPTRGISDLKHEREDLAVQLQDIKKLEARLEIELTEFEIVEVEEQRKKYLAEVAKIEPEFKRIEEELNQARTRAQNSYGHSHQLHEELSRARARLWEVDAEYRAEQEAEVERRSEEIQEAMRRQQEERAVVFSEAVDEEQKREGNYLPIAHAPGPGDE